MQRSVSRIKGLVFLFFKIVIVSGAFYFIYDRMAKDELLSCNGLQAQVFFKQPWYVYGLVFGLAVLNRVLEVLKWQNLVSTIKPISFLVSCKQVLGALTLAMFTPNGIGEYAGKALFFSKDKVKQIVLLNVVCNGVQLFITLVMGFLGMLYFNYYYHSIGWTTILLGGVFVGIMVCLFYFLKQVSVKGFSLNVWYERVKLIPKVVHKRNFVLGVFRYLILVHQYYVLFLFFDLGVSYFVMLCVIALVHFLGSSLPSFSFLDFAVKGSVGVFFFGLLGISEWIVLFVSTLMWLLNTVFPVIIGSFYVLNFRLKDSNVN